MAGWHTAAAPGLPRDAVAPPGSQHRLTQRARRDGEGRFALRELGVSGQQRQVSAIVHTPLSLPVPVSLP